VSLRRDGRLQAPRGRYRALGAFLEYERVLTEDAKVSWAPPSTASRPGACRGWRTGRRGGSPGFSAELRYRFVKPTPSSPFGLAFSLEPGSGSGIPAAASGGRGYGLEAKLILDGALVPDRVFGAVNLLYEIERFRPPGLAAFDEDGERVSLSDPQAATFARAPAEREDDAGRLRRLAFKVADDVFLGGEARYLRKYEGFNLRSFEGQAFFLGPPSWRSSPRTSPVGHVERPGGGAGPWRAGRLDLDNFEQHQARLKLKRGLLESVRFL
jgi:hypothetical protein